MTRTQLALVTPSLAVGGAEALVSQLAVELDSLSVAASVVVLDSPSGSANESVLEERVNVVYLDAMSLGHASRARAVGGALSRLKPTVLHTHLTACLYVAPWALIHRIRWVHTIHSEPSKEVSPRIQALMAACYASGRAIPVSISGGLASRTARHYHLPLGRVQVVYNGVGMSSRPMDAIQDSEPLTIVSVGRMNPNKNQTMAIRALAELRRRGISVQLVLVGDGESKEALVREVRSLGLDDSVQFRGVLSDVWPELWRASCFVLTSHYEGLPMSILEALGAGLPIVSTDVGAVREVVGGAGLLVPAGDLAALVDSLEVVLGDSRLRASMAAAALSGSERFAIRRVAENYVRLYRNES